MEKAVGAFLTIGELSADLGLPQHILRYWESRFPQLRPLQRSGNRRYYRPADVALARQIHRLLTVEGFTVRGAQKALADGWTEQMEAVPKAEPPIATEPSQDSLLPRLEAIRAELADALGL
jgi:DNA-binding transcriptional MerR regulator